MMPPIPVGARTERADLRKSFKLSRGRDGSHEKRALSPKVPRRFAIPQKLAVVAEAMRPERLPSGRGLSAIASFSAVGYDYIQDSGNLIEE
jgi:hypothetical protein